MPRRETFMTVKNGDEIVEVVKTYDEGSAREAFRSMDDDALAYLVNSLNLESLFEPSELPVSTDEGYRDFIWDVIVNEAREDWNLVSYFVVAKSIGSKSDELFVSPDWPTAEAYVKRMGLPEVAAAPSPA